MAKRLVVKYAENAYAYIGMPCSSRAATGIAVPTAVASKAIRNTTETMPMLSARYVRPSIPSGSRGPAGAGASTSSMRRGTSASRGSRAVMSQE